MPNMTLYHMTPSRSSIVHWMLEEVGEPFEIHLLNGKRGDNRKAEYLAVNPMGKVPALRHRDTIITEAAAICTYLADEFPGKKLNVPVGTPRRGSYLKWMFFGPSCVEPVVTDRAFPRKDPPPPGALGHGSYDTVVDILANAVATGPFIMGEQFTAADVVIGSGIRWGTTFKLLPQRTEFTSYMARLSERPALQRAEAKDKELASE